MIDKNPSAIILAAGMSSRLYPITKDIPKCLLKIDGKQMLLHQLDLLNNLGVKNISIVTGYQSEQIIKFAPESIKTYYYPNYQKTNNLLTLKSISSILEGDTIILFSDLLLSKSIIKNLISTNDGCTLAIDRRNILDSTMFVRTDQESVVDIGPHLNKEDRSGNFIGIAYFSQDFIKLIKHELNEISEDDVHFKDKYYTEVLRNLIKKGYSLNFFDVADPQVWYEVDTVDEYQECLSQGVECIYET